MVSIYEGKESIESNRLCKLLLQINIRTIGDSLFIKPITKERKKMKIKTEERRQLLINN